MTFKNIMFRDIELDRTVDFQAGGSLTASALNSQFDTIVMALQDNIQGQDQAISFPPDEALTISQRTLPAKANRFNKLLAFDGTGTLTLTSDITSGDGNVTANVVTANTFVGLTGFSGTFTGSLIGTASSIANHDTDALSEGSSNLYFTKFSWYFSRSRRYWYSIKCHDCKFINNNWFRRN